MLETNIQAVARRNNFRVYDGEGDSRRKTFRSRARPKSVFPDTRREDTLSALQSLTFLNPYIFFAGREEVLEIMTRDGHRSLLDLAATIAEFARREGTKYLEDMSAYGSDYPDVRQEILRIQSNPKARMGEIIEDLVAAFMKTPVTFSTAHAYKGIDLSRDATLLYDAHMFGFKIIDVVHACPQAIPDDEDIGL